MAVTNETVVAALHKVLPPTIEDHKTPYAQAGAKLRKVIGNAGVSTPRTVTREENSKLRDQKQSANLSVSSLVKNVLAPRRGLGHSPMYLENVSGGGYFNETELATNPILSLFRTPAGIDLYKKLSYEGPALYWVALLGYVSARRFDIGIPVPQGFLSRPINTFLKYRDGLLDRLEKKGGDYRKLIQKQEHILAQIQMNLEFLFSPQASSYAPSMLRQTPIPVSVQSLLDNHFRQLASQADDCRHLSHPYARTFLTMELMLRFIDPWELPRTTIGQMIPDHAEVSAYMQTHDLWKPLSFVNILNRNGALRDDLKIL